jgi:energy-converting hydrogenase Eha subunit E
MDREQTIKCLSQVIEILRPLNINLNAPAVTPVETAYFHICALYTYLNVDAITVSR